MKDENLDDIVSVVAQEPNLVISMVTEKGDVIWFISDDITLQQEKMFQRFAVVSKNPSFVLLFFLKVEIILLGITLWIENKIKKGR
tara:strand:+ start:601 stop:858 length:258 start_codon:yes stop_codon:yes gene_type:complete